MRRSFAPASRLPYLLKDADMMIPTLAKALADKGYDTLTDVQEAVTNPELVDQDMLVSAQTGSGKTVGFGLAIAPTILDGEAFGPAATPLALVIAPTRELAMQVKFELSWLYAHTGARIASCVGGMDQRTERRALERGAHIVVGTPGRLRDHITRGALVLDALKAVVLDEADEMLDMGFKEDLEFMLDATPEERRSLLFSATVSPLISKLAKQYQRDAVRVSTVSKEKQHADIEYQALRVADRDEEHAIINILRYHDAQNAIVFANTRATVNRLTTRLSNRGLPVVCLSGELSQAERSNALQSMRDGRARVCVATDVAARGIDLPMLDLVIHAELPTNTEGLLHRSGRTGRAGRKGTSALIVPPKMVKRAERLLRWAKITAKWDLPPSADEIRTRDVERLMEHPTWNEGLTGDEGQLAGDLIARFTPEQIATACIRLHRVQFSAPEELAEIGARPARREDKDFGPSTWFSLSVGRKQNAEPRWLLPMLCRSGNLDKNDIGAIRVQGRETFVELSNDSVEKFLGASGGGELEDGIRATQLEGKPDLSAPPRKQGGKFGDKPNFKGKGKFDRDDRAPKPHRKGSGEKREAGDRPAKSDKPAKPLRKQNQRDDRASAPSANKGGRWSPDLVPEVNPETKSEYKTPEKRDEKKSRKSDGTPTANPNKKRDEDGNKQRWKKEKPGKKGKGAKPGSKPAKPPKVRKNQPRGENALPRRVKK
ncbi:DEAD/DEAH box helicase [Aliiroseovarius sp. KMU-50]|uniref:DEAD/DEAH box helicase n=1 Tax=Aliiroseovarius salicola TaxID=3009082 RepID=A0ABT4W4V0_9RHOB|nr:DEAD/DEAH box helicase [Aliiroseovarius sp. KMU-50]MDA5095534.1 DEAD/DEAH box helicase [Aliiroseovarius sp. KMU-50]